MRCSILIPTAFVAAAGVVHADPIVAEVRIKLHATVAMLPKTEPCDGRINRVATLYRVDKVVQGKFSDKTILVVHRCPGILRGPSRIGRGDAGKIKPGKTHLLTLGPFDATKGYKVTDPFVDDRRPRWAALRTNQSTWPPRVVVVVKGGAGARFKLQFDDDLVSLGRAADSDVKLIGQEVAPRHLVLRVNGDHIVVNPVGKAATAINGKPLRRPAKITFEDRLTLGVYTVRAALYLNPK